MSVVIIINLHCMVILFPLHIDQLSPEFQRAAQFLVSHCPQEIAEDSEKVKREIYQQGEVKKFRSRILARDIPTEDGWKWNQAQAKVCIEYPNLNLKVVLSKIVSRKPRGSSVPAPSYKVWNYEVSNELGYCFNLIWCEKGKKVKRVRDLTNPHHITIQDFQFLSEFMKPSVASQFWPSLGN